MRYRVALLALALFATAAAPALAGGAASRTMFRHEIPFFVANTGTGVDDGRLRFHIDTLAVPGEEYYFDNIVLTCSESGNLVVNGDFSAGLTGWKFYTNAPAPRPTVKIDDGQLNISFGSDGSNTQLFQRDIELPPSGVDCMLTFDACSTGGPTNPGWGNNTGLELIKHGPPYTKYGLDLSGNPPNAELSIHSCSAPGPRCGDGTIDPGEACDDGGINTMTCDADCSFPVCGDGFVNPAADEECDDIFKPIAGCDMNCQLPSFCGDATVDPGEDCDEGGGTLDNPTATASASCDSDCTFVACGDGTINPAAGEECDESNGKTVVICDPGSCQIDPGVHTSVVCEVYALLGSTPVPAICQCLAFAGSPKSVLGCQVNPAVEAPVASEPRQVSKTP